MNTPTSDHVLNKIRHSKITKIVLLILIITSIIANGVQGYFIWKQVKAYRGLEAIINNKSNCDKCPEQTEPTPESSPTPTKSGGSDSNASDTVAPLEEVILPPAPPTD